MNTHEQLNLIISKVRDLQTAVFHNFSDGVLNIPSCIVHTIYVDDTGCIWFTVYKPMQYISEFDRRFPVALDYYQKGRPFSLNISGIARMVIDPEEINSLPPQVCNQAAPDKVLICVKITTANYHAFKMDSPKSPLSQLKNYLASMFSPNHWHIDLQNQAYMA
ncbi:MAG: hypothetical protein ABIN67_19535 [Ferruginibacter sp.]